MRKFQYLNADEIISHIEKYGTDDERDIVEKVTTPDWSQCPNCDEAYSMAERNETDAAEAKEERDELVAGVKGAWNKLDNAIDLLKEAQVDLE